MIKQPQTNFRRILVANRSEIAIRVFRVSVELGVETIAIYSQEDRFTLRRFKADETYLIGCGMGPVEAYLSIDEVIRVARENAVIADLPRNGGTGGGSRRSRSLDAPGPLPNTLTRAFARICRLRGFPGAWQDRLAIPWVALFPKTGEFPYNSINLDKFRQIKIIFLRLYI